MREPTSHPLRVLFLTLEFRHGTFSGNGVLSSSQAHGLAKAGHAVLVVSGCPDDVNDDEESANLYNKLDVLKAELQEETQIFEEKKKVFIAMVVDILQ